MNIFILSTPVGPAPEWVRSAWCTLEFPVFQLTDDVLLFSQSHHAGDESREKFELRGEYYLVKFQDAIGILAMRLPEAAIWWLRNRRVREYFAFPKSCCEPDAG